MESEYFRNEDTYLRNFVSNSECSRFFSLFTTPRHLRVDRRKCCQPSLTVESLFTTFVYNKLS